MNAAPLLIGLGLAWLLLRPSSSSAPASSSSPDGKPAPAPAPRAPALPPPGGAVVDVDLPSTAHLPVGLYKSSSGAFSALLAAFGVGSVVDSRSGEDVESALKVKTNGSATLTNATEEHEGFSVELAWYWHGSGDGSWILGSTRLWPA